MSITRHIGKNSGSLRSIKIIALAGVTSSPIPVNHEITAVPTVTDSWIDIEFMPGEASWQETQVDTESGPVYNYMIQCQVNKDRIEITRQLNTLAGRKAMCDVVDQNGGRRLIGEKNALHTNGAQLSFSQVKELKTGRNSYDISITYASGSPAPALNPA